MHAVLQRFDAHGTPPVVQNLKEIAKRKDQILVNAGGAAMGAAAARVS